MSSRCRAVLALALFAACHTGTRKTLVPEVPTNGDPQARDRFLEAKAKFLEDSRTSAAEFERIANEYPHDPIVPWADLYAGIASVKAHEWAKADAALAKVLAQKTNEGVDTKARLYMGIAKNYEGDAAAARTLLSGADRAIENDDERAEYLAAVAYSLAAGDHPLAALPFFDQLWPRATATERAVMIGRIAAIVQAAAPDALAKAYDDLADRKGVSIAIAGGRLALIADVTGDAAAAAKRRADIAPARAAAGLTIAISETTAGALAKSTATGAGDPSLLGAVMPLGSKRENRLAEAAVAGLGLAAGAGGGTGVVAIETRAAVDKDAAVTAVEALAAQNVIAIVGPIDGASVDAAGARADGLGVPLISLATAPEQHVAPHFVFHIRHSAEARARTLAKLAVGRGVKTFAVFAPDSGYGKAVTTAFADAVEKAGGTIVKRVTYAKDAKSFAKPAKDLGDGWQAVFVPDSADVLALVVPAIAAAGNVPKPMPFPKKVLGGRPVLLLSTAEDLTADFLTSAGHNADGALLAPGFYPDDADPATKPFLDRFVAAYGHAPGAGEAYAYDAAELVASANGGSRSSLEAQLAQSSLGGVTGTIKFDGDHRRADPGVVYTVVEETGNTWAIRVAK
jgi:branched-chain amino acid transport system substrate-binding protein